MTDPVSPVRTRRPPAWKHRRTRLLAAAGGLAIALVPAAPGLAAPAPIPCGTVLTASVTLQADMLCTGDALVAGADGITVDLGGHTVQGTGTGAGVRIDGVESVNVRNGKIAGFAQDVAVFDGRGAALAGLTLEGGIAARVQFSSDVRLVSSTLTDARVSAESSPRMTIARVSGSNARLNFVDSFDSSVTRSQLTDGLIGVTQSNRVSIVDNRLLRASVDLLASSDTLVERNSIYSVAGGGVNIGSTVDGSRIVGNTFSRNQVGVLARVQLVGELDGTVITGNTFVGNGAAGALVDVTGVLGAPTVTIERNLFFRNGFDNGGRTDRQGRPVADGLHISVPAGSGIVVANNETRGNARYGIFADPGTVADGGGNTSTGDPLGCLGVACA